MRAQQLANNNYKRVSARPATSSDMHVGQNYQTQQSDSNPEEGQTARAKKRQNLQKIAADKIQLYERLS